MEEIASIYVATLSRSVGGRLIPFEAIDLRAHGDADALRLAREWRSSELAPLIGDAWLEVIKDGKVIVSEKL
jgi:hypothetical protein